MWPAVVAQLCWAAEASGGGTALGDGIRGESLRELFLVDLDPLASQCAVQAALDPLADSRPPRVDKQEAPPRSPIVSITVHLLTRRASHE